jgi:predicted transcriptional regulator
VFFFGLFTGSSVVQQGRREISLRKIARRDKLKIYGDLLSVLNEYRSEKVVLTQVQIRINVPFDRLKVYMTELEKLGLIQTAPTPTVKLTGKGKEYLKEYRNVLEFMKRMGLSYQ